MATSILPAGFVDLEPSVVEWALASECERAVKRIETVTDRLRSFHDAVLARIHDIIRYFNRLPNDPDAWRRCSWRQRLPSISVGPRPTSKTRS